MRILVLDLDGAHGRNLRVVLEAAGHEVEVAAVAPDPSRRELELIVVVGAGARERVAALRRRDPSRPIAAIGERVPGLPELVESDGCLFDLDRCVAVRDGKPIALAPREAALVRWLHGHRDRPVSRREILEHVFRVSPNIESRSVDMAIATLRKKIERAPERPAIIVSVKGLGYAWHAG